MYSHDQKEPVLKQVQAWMETNGPKDHPIRIAVDGRCASGKSTLGEMLAKELGGTLVHMDDFFLRPEQRTKERYASPGENLDWERIQEEILMPLAKNQSSVSYQLFDCSKMALTDWVKLDGTKPVVFEGTYSQNSHLKDFYDLKIFVNIDPAAQQRRLLEREGAKKLEDFNARWIPLEELYFQNVHPEKQADLSF